MAIQPLLDILQENKKASGGSSKQQGVYSVCSSDELVLRASLRQALEDRQLLLVEATCNQVNQFGGYTGMTPKDFCAAVGRLIRQEGFPRTQVILGGDHLGPNVWRKDFAQEAMAKAEDLVRAYVTAGFEKIHLDCSMACADDPLVLPPEVIAARAVRLCLVAEEAAQKTGRRPAYVIGTEVPPPGGAKEGLRESRPTPVEEALQTIRIHRGLFEQNGLSEAWARVIALVVQPGVEFDHWRVQDYDPAAAQALSEAVQSVPAFVYEAHSTDYQKPAAYKSLVEGHFAILKVGPALTYALREALFLLETLSREIGFIPSGIGVRRRLLSSMKAHPAHWQAYYYGTEAEKEYACLFSLSDRCRYYWAEKAMIAEVEDLLGFFETRSVPPVLISQYFPNLYDEVRQKAQSPSGRDLAILYIRDRVLRAYGRGVR